MRKSLFVAAVCAVVGITAAQAESKVFRWVDSSGNVHYTDQAPSKGTTSAAEIHPKLAGSGVNVGEVDRHKLAESAVDLCNRAKVRVNELQVAGAQDEAHLKQQQAALAEMQNVCAESEAAQLK